MKDTQKSAKSNTATGKKPAAFTDEERAAMKERAQAVKADRVMAERLHAVIKASAPAISSRLWYGMPAYAKDGSVVCFFQPAQKFKTRCATLGFSDKSIDDGVMWLNSYALTELTPVEGARIGELVKRVKRAVS